MALLYDRPKKNLLKSNFSRQFAAEWL